MINSNDVRVKTAITVYDMHDDQEDLLKTLRFIVKSEQETL